MKFGIVVYKCNFRVWEGEVEDKGFCYFWLGREFKVSFGCRRIWREGSREGGREREKCINY